MQLQHVFFVDEAIVLPSSVPQNFYVIHVTQQFSLLFIIKFQCADQA